jgi:hypothetical protein
VRVLVQECDRRVFAMDDFIQVCSISLYIYACHLKRRI